MTTYKERMAADLRLTALRLLAAASGYELNGSILRMALEDYGHDVSTDHLNVELAWLEEQGLVTVRAIGSVRVATLTVRGLDAGAGRSIVPGVARPGPEADL
ncbi:MAG: hypothetical protein KGL35_16810 [Bradyrhizobium sp.]|nr:hypothetical protein [Bradyrhizobium sp.]